MSFSALTKIEECPLCWTLSNGEYSDLWPGTGYPAKVGVSAIVGQVIHSAVEAVLRDANSSEDGSFANRMMLAVRSAGGLTALIEQTLGQVLDNYVDNPRMTALTTGLRSGRLTLPPTVRTSLQSLLSKVANQSVPVSNRRAANTNSRDSEATALPFGIYTEIGLYATGMAWYGKIDILINGSGDVAIEDIKTGKHKDADREQLYVYSWLWWRDGKRNPRARLSSRLAIQYVDSSLDIPALSESELKQFEADLVDRTAKAVADISDGIGEARPDAEICRYCRVRQLCDDYWTGMNLAGTRAVSSFGDAEARLVRVLSQKTWQIEVVSGSHLAAGTRALLRGKLPADLAQIGALVRIVDARIVEPSADGPAEQVPEIQLGSQSEIFVRTPEVTFG